MYLYTTRIVPPKSYLYIIIGTLQVHLYYCILGLWSSPSMKGIRPPPSSDFSLTMTDKNQAVMFGGYIPLCESSKAHTLHLPTMVSQYVTVPEKRVLVAQ